MIVNGPLSGRRFEVKEGGLRLGRSSSNDIHVPDEELSRNHCLFEQVGEADICVTDLASANGTILNGRTLGASPQTLKPGDTIEVGQTRLKVLGDALPKGGAPDLGLGAKGGPAAANVRRSPLANVLWLLVVVAAAAAVWLALTAPRQEMSVTSETLALEEKPSLCEVHYEKVDATLEGVCRYEVRIGADGTVRVVLDDTKENRHLSIPAKALGVRAQEELGDILSLEALRAFDREYSGPEPEPQALASRDLSVVYTTCAQRIRVINAQEPEALRAIFDRLEAFVNNELGIHAIRYPREKLVKMAEEQIEVGRAKWEDREVQYGNLFAAVRAYREAIFYLETLDPKPACIQEARDGFKLATAELETRYGNQRFVVDRAINLGDWEAAQRELGVLLEMIPDRKDDRHREASAKLVDVENRLKGGK